jgi:hypothetical protein
MAWMDGSRLFLTSFHIFTKPAWQLGSEGELPSSDGDKDCSAAGDRLIRSAARW